MSSPLHDRSPEVNTWQDEVPAVLSMKGADAQDLGGPEIDPTTPTDALPTWSARSLNTACGSREK